MRNFCYWFEHRSQSPEKDCLRCLMMTSAQVVETSVHVISNSPSQDYTHADVPTYDKF